MNIATYQSSQGVKQVPFDRKGRKPNLAYKTRSIELNRNSVLGPSGLQCGMSHFGEYLPSAICSAGFQEISLYWTPDGASAYARAYQKFKDSAYTQAANLTALKERAKTINMIGLRLQTLNRGAKALRDGRFREFLQVFGVHPLKKHEGTKWTRPRDFGALWLEYWMGWAPTVGDINNSIEALSRRIPEETIRAGSTTPLFHSYVTKDGGATATSSYEGKGTVWIQSQIIVTNPTLHIAQTLGLVNPLKTFWETVKFSWLVDWASNVGQVLGQLTDWVGLQLSNIVVSVKTVATSSWSCYGAQSIYGWTFPDVMSKSKEFFWFDRYILPALPVLPLKWKLPVGLSLSRGATAASLLLTMFAPLKNK